MVYDYELMSMTRTVLRPRLDKSVTSLQRSCGSLTPKDSYIQDLDEWQHYTALLWQLQKEGAIRIAVHSEEGYPFTAEGIKQAHEDLGKQTLFANDEGPVLKASVCSRKEDDGQAHRAR